MKELFGLLGILGSLTLVATLLGTHNVRIVGAIKSVPTAWWWLKRAMGFEDTDRAASAPAPLSLAPDEHEAILGRGFCLPTLTGRGAR
jgi:hypothetical protein